MKNSYQDKLGSLDYSILLLIYTLIKKYWMQIMVVGILYWMYNENIMQIGISQETIESGSFVEVDAESFADQSLVELGSFDVEEVPQAKPENVSHLDGGRRERKTRVTHKPATTARTTRNRAVVFSGSVRERQLAYIRTYAALARDQMRKHGIPASITLAQGLLESNIGNSRLAKENNNHFGIKCFSTSCSKGHCSNFSDDSHKDFFRKFASVAESFHAHSALLKKPRYRSLYKLSPDDYKGWARGLRRAGYATDRSYDAKLIHLIESLELYKYDS
jgi:flagellum-specific peptidoglycan hydrolase FlgJ